MTGSIKRIRRAHGDEGTRSIRLKKPHSYRRVEDVGADLSERQWGTVREDYSESGDAWNFFTHGHARSAPTAGAKRHRRHLRRQRLCFRPVEQDPILKECSSS